MVDLGDLPEVPVELIDPRLLATNDVPDPTAAGANTGVSAPANPGSLANLPASALHVTGVQPGAVAVAGSGPLPRSTAGPASFTIGYIGSPAFTVVAQPAMPSQHQPVVINVWLPGTGPGFTYRERAMAADFLSRGLNAQDAQSYRKLYESVTVVETIRDQLNDLIRNNSSNRASYEQQALAFIHAYGLRTQNGHLMGWTNIRSLRDYASRWGPRLLALEDRASAVRSGNGGNDPHANLRRVRGSLT